MVNCIWVFASKTSNAEWLDKRIEACRNICFAGQGIGSHRVPMTPKTSDKLYKDICIPKLTYGLTWKHSIMIWLKCNKGCPDNVVILGV